MRSILVRSLLVGLLSFTTLTIPAQCLSNVRVAVSVAIAPPDLPLYDQPACPGDGYIWTPGYWAWDPGFDDYYWVPGTWVLAPQPGFLWTPGYWAWGGSGFVFTAGYWGPVVGFYGGINYGFGYFGDGYVGGRWDHGHFFYNTALNNVNVTIIHNTYRTTVVHNDVTRVSYSGGNGGITAHPTQEQEVTARERHIGPVAAQTEQINDARDSRDLRASVNHGRPDIAATPKPGDFKGHDVVPAREAGTVHTDKSAPENGGEGNAAKASRGAIATREFRPESSATASRRVIHPSDIPPAEKPPAPSTGNAKLDQKYQQQQEKLAEKQAKENQKLQQRQDQEHQRANRQQANEFEQQQMEQRHQQQTQQLMQRHQQENQQLQQHQQSEHAAAPSAHGPAPEKKP